MHSGFGYLVSEFLDSTINHRTDEWGGSIENRARFGLEVLKAIFETWEPNRVGIKVTPTGGQSLR